MKRTSIALIALLGAAVASPAMPQPGPGMGGRFAFGADNTPGWALMNKAERDAHRQKMWSFKDYAECKAYQQEHHAVMEARAKELGKSLAPPRANACDRMQARGVFK